MIILFFQNEYLDERKNFHLRKEMIKICWKVMWSIEEDKFRLNRYRLRSNLEDLVLHNLVIKKFS